MLYTPNDIDIFCEKLKKMDADIKNRRYKDTSVRVNLRRVYTLASSQAKCMTNKQAKDFMEEKFTQLDKEFKRRETPAWEARLFYIWWTICEKTGIVLRKDFLDEERRDLWEYKPQKPITTIDAAEERMLKY